MYDDEESSDGDYIGEVDMDGKACGFGVAIKHELTGTFLNDKMHGFCKFNQSSISSDIKTIVYDKKSKQNHHEYRNGCFFGKLTERYDIKYINSVNNEGRVSFENPLDFSA